MIKFQLENGQTNRQTIGLVKLRSATKKIKWAGELKSIKSLTVTAHNIQEGHWSTKVRQLKTRKNKLQNQNSRALKPSTSSLLS